MFKKILTFSLAVLLAACAGVRVKEIPADVRDYKRVDFFTQGRTQAAFKVTGQMNEDYMDGVLRIKKIGEQDFDVVLMTPSARKGWPTAICSKMQILRPYVRGLRSC